MTIMIIPHSDKKTVSFFLDSRKIKTIKYAFLLFVLIIFIGGFHFFRYLNTLKAENYKLLERNKKYADMEDKIKEYNQQKKQLEEKIIEMEEKIARIEELENKLNKLIKENTFNVEVNTLLTKKSSSLSSRGDVNREELLTKLKDLDEKLGEKENNLKNLSKALIQLQDKINSIPDIMPVQGEITSHFGYRKSPFGKGKEFHDGIDISAPYGTEIKAAANGIVTFAGYKPGYGYTVILNHSNGIETAYSHVSKIIVRKGQKVSKGQAIALIGSSGRSTGPHLHFSVIHNGRLKNPLEYINKLN
ncbi:MAG: peptidoglycan DD-metalloendopeptidase family protein [Thermovenabulum sp.]|uniref:M23 family metallopeptidase n=1 Tax=Thermovenabulum sp. TaxID=3100335 RepID=UPI003C7E680E